MLDCFAGELKAGDVVKLTAASREYYKRKHRWSHKLLFRTATVIGPDDDAHGYIFIRWDDQDEAESVHYTTIFRSTANQTA